MAPPFTPKLFRQHLDYIKHGFSSPTSQPKFTSSTDKILSTPTLATLSMSPTSSPTQGLKRKAESTSPDEPASKRAYTGVNKDENTSPRKLVPVVSRTQTSAQLQLHHNTSRASTPAREDDSDDDFVDAKEHVAADAFPEADQSSFTNMDALYGNGVSDNDMALPSSLMPDAGNDMSLFPGLHGSYDLHAEDVSPFLRAYSQEAVGDTSPTQADLQGRQYGRERDNGEATVYDDGQSATASDNPEAPLHFDREEEDNGGRVPADVDDQFSIQHDAGSVVVHDYDTVKLDADGIPEMADEAAALGVQTPEQQLHMPITFEFEDDENEPDLDAFIAEANGTQDYSVPIENDLETDEGPQAAEDPVQLQPPVHSQDSHGVHKLVAQDGQVDQFIIETGAIPHEEKEQSIYDQTRLFSPVHTSPELQQTADEQSNGIFSPVDYSTSSKNSNDDEIQIVDSNTAALTQSFKAKGYAYKDPSDRVATPPLRNPLEGVSPKSQQQLHPTTGEVYNVSKTAASTASLRAAELAHLNGTSGPLVPRDLQKLLKSYHDLHSRVSHLVPYLPNHASFPWHRRYWIAVLYSTKNPKTASKPRDFMWMKGNKHSTISTIWHNYALRTMEDEFVLTCRGELTDMDNVVEELDWFNSKLVILRAVKRESRAFEMMGLGEGQEPNMWKGMGVVPRSELEIVTLED